MIKLLSTIIVLCFLLFVPTKSFSETPPYSRIISLAPSITETLFALGLNNQIVGVTRYCTYPPAATKKTQIGGYLDPNYEAMMTLKPDLIIALPEHQGVGEQLDLMEADRLEINNKSVEHILAGIQLIGETCGKSKEATHLINKIESKIKNIQKQALKYPQKPRVILNIGRNVGSGEVKNVTIAGKHTYYGELIQLAGGVNAYQENRDFPSITPEGLIHLNPDVIIDLVPGMDKKGVTKKEILTDWSSLFGMSAIKTNRVYILEEDYVVIPGPRFIHLLEDIFQVLH